MEFLRYFNKDPLTPVMQFIYVGNEGSEEELKALRDKMDIGGSATGGYHFAFNDEKAIELREKLKIEGVPAVVVLDRNMEIVTKEGAMDLTHLPPDGVRRLWI